MTCNTDFTIYIQLKKIEYRYWLKAKRGRKFDISSESGCLSVYVTITAKRLSTDWHNVFPHQCSLLQGEAIYVYGFFHFPILIRKKLNGGRTVCFSQCKVSLKCNFVANWQNNIFLWVANFIFYKFVLFSLLFCILTAFLRSFFKYLNRTYTFILFIYFGWLRIQNQISIIRSVSLRLRGTRGKIRSLPFEDGAAIPSFEI